MSRPDLVFYHETDGYEIPDPPENPEFNELFSDRAQDAITRRFEAGIAKNERALYEARKRRTDAVAAQRARADARKAERERYLARRTPCYSTWHEYQN